MITAFYTAAVGTSQTQKGFDVIANNAANVSTVGYKRQETSFQDLLYTDIRPYETGLEEAMGHGAKLAKTDDVHVQGMLQPSEGKYDYAIVGDGFFGVMVAEGEMKYTRAGAFQQTIVDGVGYLSSPQGGFIVDTNGEPIEVTGVSGESLDIGIFVFPNDDGLLREAGLYFNETVESGSPTLISGEDVLQAGYLEGSNVDLADHMVEMIYMQRAFQMNTKVVQVADEIMQTVNSLR